MGRTKAQMKALNIRLKDLERGSKEEKNTAEDTGSDQRASGELTTEDLRLAARGPLNHKAMQHSPKHEALMNVTATTGRERLSRAAEQASGRAGPNVFGFGHVCLGCVAIVSHGRAQPHR